MTIDRKKRVLQITWNIAAVICAILIEIAATPSLAKLVAPDSEFAGDLYKMNKIDIFRLPIQRGGKTSTTSFDDGSVITIGDSFFDITYEGSQFSVRFEEATGRPTYNIDYDITKKIYTINPTSFFKEHPVANSPRILLWERVERNLVNDILDARESVITTELEQLLPARVRSSDAYEEYTRLRDIAFHTEPLVFLLQNSLWTKRMYEIMNTFRFRVTRDLPPLTPEYSRDPLMLFYGPALKTSRATLSDKEIEAAAERIANEYRSLEQAEGIEPIFLPLPSKETVYRRLSRDPSYNDFLPRLTRELEKRQVRVINMLPIYEAYDATHDDLLYYPTDTHWNGTAMHLLITKIESMLQAEGL